MVSRWGLRGQDVKIGSWGGEVGGGMNGSVGELTFALVSFLLLSRKGSFYFSGSCPVGFVTCLGLRFASVLEGCG